MLLFLLFFPLAIGGLVFILREQKIQEQDAYFCGTCAQCLCI